MAEKSSRTFTRQNGRAPVVTENAPETVAPVTLENDAPETVAPVTLDNGAPEDTREEDAQNGAPEDTREEDAEFSLDEYAPVARETKARGNGGIPNTTPTVHFGVDAETPRVNLSRAATELLCETYGFTMESAARLRRFDMYMLPRAPYGTLDDGKRAYIENAFALEYAPEKKTAFTLNRQLKTGKSLIGAEEFFKRVGAENGARYVLRVETAKRNGAEIKIVVGKRVENGAEDSE